MCMRKRKRERDVDEANSKRDVLLIILTPGVRLNERRSQTHEAQCKFNYREKGRPGGEGERHNVRENEASRSPSYRLCPRAPASAFTETVAAVTPCPPPCTRGDWTR